MDEELLKGKHLLIVDDEVDLREILASELEFMGSKVYQAGNVATAKELLSKHPIDLIISDIRMPGGTGIDLLDIVKAHDVNTPPVLLITGFADITIEDAFNLGAEALINKPFKLDDLIRTAAKFTLPHSARLSLEDIEATKKMSFDFPLELSEMIKTQKCLIGRGGIALTIGLKGRKIDLTAPVELELNFKDRGLRGTMHCRWIKHQEETFNVKAGFEFLHLEKDSLDFVLKYLEKNKQVPFIPSLT